jgi:hypothetical protein
MTKMENIKIEFSDLQELLKCCDSALDSLNGFHGQLVKIIEAKKKLSDKASDNAVFSQASDVLSSVANLEEISSKLPDAIGEIKQLSQQSLLLLKQFNPRPAVGLSSNNENFSRSAEGMAGGRVREGGDPSGQTDKG